MKGQFQANISNKEMEGVFSLISHTWFTSEIFKTLFAIKNR